MKYIPLLGLATAFVVFSISAHAAEVFRVTTIGKLYPTTKAVDFNSPNSPFSLSDDASNPGIVVVDGGAVQDPALVAVAISGSAEGTVVLSADGQTVESVTLSGGLSGYTDEPTLTWTGMNVDPTVSFNFTYTNVTNQYIPTNYNNPALDAGNGSGWGGGVTRNFNGTNSAINPGDQRTSGNTTTTYFGPTVYAGVNRDTYDTGAGVIHSDGNGYRLKSNAITADEITGNGGNPFNTKAVFMFDADTSSLSGQPLDTGENDNLIFGDSDTLTAKLAVPAHMATKASLATYRAMVKAKGPNDATAQYYAGSLETVDLAALGTTTSVLDMSESAANATWTLMPDMEKTNNLFQSEADHPKNLTVDTSASATTVPGKFLTNITQVGFLLETDTNQNTGGYNYGVREFIAQASPASAPHPIEWSQDFTSPVTILSELSADSPAYTWYKSGGGLTGVGEVGDPDYVSEIAVVQASNSVILSITENGNNGEVYLNMVGPGTTNDRFVRPVSHETTWEIDLIAFRQGDATLSLQTRGFDGIFKSAIEQSGKIKFSHTMNSYDYTSIDSFIGSAKLRKNNNNNNSGVRIITGGTFDGSGGVTVDISAPVDSTGATVVGGVQATATVIMNSDNTAIERVAIVNQGSGYISEPTVTFAGGGMTVEPTFSFNYTTGNISNSNFLELNIGALEDDQILTYTQSYDNSDDSLSFYYSLDGSDPQLIHKLTAADHSAGGYGFYDLSTGNKWGTPSNQQAVSVHYKRWNSADATASTVAINSVSVATSDDDRDGVINRNDAFSNNPLESVDSDSDSVGNNSDQYEGYNDGAVTTLASAISTAQALQGTGDAAGTNTFEYYVGELGYSSGGGAITQEAYDAVVNARDTAQNNLNAKQTELDNAKEARPGSTVIDVANDVATITLTVEQTSDVSDWSSGTTSDHDIQLSAPAGASFYRFTIPE
jgi:hypothetical protein